MAFFQYRAADQAGKVVDGVIEADAEQSVILRLREMGCVPLRIALPSERAVGKVRQPLLPARRKVSQQQLLQFTRELGTLLSAGLPLDRSLSILGGLVEGGELSKILRSLVEAVRAGKSLAASMGEHPDVFPKIYVNMIRAGEAGGILEGVLRYLTEYLESTLALKEEVKSALIYPAILASAAGLSLIVMFVFVIPRFSAIFKDVNKSLPLITKLVINLSLTLSQYGWIILLVVVGMVAAAIYYIRTPEGKGEWDRLCLRAWLLGELVRKFETARFARTLSALMKGGVPLLESLGTVQGVIGNHLLARPLSESGLFPPLALNMIAVGEETGKLDAMLAEIANYYDQEVKRTTKRLTALLEPALILVMGLIVGVVVISMLLAIFSINDLPF
jgi:general secretion pathway protein F